MLGFLRWFRDTGALWGQRYTKEFRICFSIFLLKTAFTISIGSLGKNVHRQLTVGNSPG